MTNSDAVLTEDEEIELFTFLITSVRTRIQRTWNWTFKRSPGKNSRRP